MSKLFSFLYKYKIIILTPLLLLLISLGLFHLYDDRYICHITAKFDDSGPLYVNMPIYYKGYKIGHTTDIKLTEDYSYTLVRIDLYAQKPKLPANIIAKVKKRDTKTDYIELTIPDDPSAVLIENGSIIDGQAAFDLETFLSTIMDSGMLDPIIDNASQLLSSFSDTSDKIGSFFSDSNVILKDNKQNIKHTTTSLTEITSKINTSIKKEQLSNTMSSVDKSSTNILTATENIKNITCNVGTATESVKNITCNVEKATKNLDQTMTKIDCTISNVNATASNVKNITGGLCEVLGKRFAGLRIIFGKPMKKNACQNNCNNCSK